MLEIDPEIVHKVAKVFITLAKNKYCELFYQWRLKSRGDSLNYTSID